MAAPKLTDEARQFFAKCGKKGGTKTSAAKAAAAQKNGAMPRKDGKPRGWPKGKPRNPCPSCAYEVWIQNKRKLWVCASCGEFAPIPAQPVPKVHPPGCACHGCIRRRMRARQ